jgi:branched-chain amino acid transport system ATP-binding protein
VLEIRDLTIKFGGLTAIDGLNLKVDEWEIVGLMGPNGAGKTTAFNCITGFYKPTRGRVFFKGADVTKVPPHRKAAMGIGRTFQNVGMVKSETALENLLTAQHTRAGYGAAQALTGSSVVRQREKELVAHAEVILDLLGLADIRDRRIGALPYGTLKLLELGCALATDPELLLLDEPAAGLDLGAREALLRLLTRLAADPGSPPTVLVTHHPEEVPVGTTHALLLSRGRTVAAGPVADVLTAQQLSRAFGLPLVGDQRDGRFTARASLS